MSNESNRHPADDEGVAEAEVERARVLRRKLSIPHRITLPHPPGGTNARPVEGVCSCGQWRYSYWFGSQGRAEELVEEHIREESLAEPVSSRSLDGTILVTPGLSL